MTASPASQGASPAPSASQGSTAGQGVSQGSTAGQGGNDAGMDVQRIWKEAREARQEAGKLKTVFDRELGGINEDRQVLQKLKGAFAPEAPKEADPIEDLTGSLDFFLENAMEMKAKGTPIPLTTKLAVESFQTMIAQQKAIQDLTKQIQELKGGVDRANDPESPVNNMAYAQMETFMTSAIDGLYGNDPGSQGAKTQVYDGVVRLVHASLRELQSKAPQEWDRVRRQPQALQQIVNAAIKKMVPPRAYQILEQEQLKNTPMQEGELWAAFREAKQIQDPQKRVDLIREIRRDILEAQQRSRSRRR